ncbi:MAG: hypothetical protein ACNS62_10755 [Candidatus Cyclobacteriaceae bacterium M3_2C_046]
MSAMHLKPTCQTTLSIRYLDIKAIQATIDQCYQECGGIVYL